MREIFEGLEKCIDEMAKSACAVASLLGLRGVPASLGKTGDQWELPVTEEIARRCGYISQPPYWPAAVSRFNAELGEKKESLNGDLLIRRDDRSKVFVEAKPIFLHTLQRLDPPKDVDGTLYHHDYRAENPLLPGAWEKSIIAAKRDIRKLDCLRAVAPEYHLGLLLLEFDTKGDEVSDRSEYRELRDRLSEDGWSMQGRKTWIDKVPIRAENNFQEHLVFWSKAGVNPS